MINGDAYTVVSCHPTEEGFILVTQESVSFWEYKEKNELNLNSNFMPFEEVKKTTETQKFKKGKIQSSAFVEGVLYLKVIDSPGSISSSFEIIAFDLKDNKTSLMTIEKKACLQLLSFKENLFITYFKDKNYFLSKIKMRNKFINPKLSPEKNIWDMEFDSTLKLPQYIFLSSIQSANWVAFYPNAFPNDHCVNVVNLETNELWQNTSIAPVKNWAEGSIHLNNDFLLLTYHEPLRETQGSFRIFYLPTKEELTSLLKPYLQDYLKPGIELFSIEFVTDKDLCFCLQVYLKKLLVTSFEILKVTITIESDVVPKRWLKKHKVDQFKN